MRTYEEFYVVFGASTSLTQLVFGNWGLGEISPFLYIL